MAGRVDGYKIGLAICRDLAVHDLGGVMGGSASPPWLFPAGTLAAMLGWLPPGRDARSGGRLRGSKSEQESYSASPTDTDAVIARKASAPLSGQ